MPGTVQHRRSKPAGGCNRLHSIGAADWPALLRFLRSPKTQITLCFNLKIPDCCLNLLFLPCGRMLPEWRVVCREVTGDLPY